MYVRSCTSTVYKCSLETLDININIVCTGHKILFIKANPVSEIVRYAGIYSRTTTSYFIQYYTYILVFGAPQVGYVGTYISMYSTRNVAKPGQPNSLYGQHVSSMFPPGLGREGVKRQLAR
jgi:hypothetical protein